MHGVDGAGYARAYLNAFDRFHPSGKIIPFGDRFLQYRGYRYRGRRGRRGSRFGGPTGQRKGAGGTDAENGNGDDDCLAGR